MMNIEAPPVKAVPEAVRNRPTPQNSRFKAVPEWERSEAPHPHQKGHHCSRLPHGLAHQKIRVEVDEMEVEDANPSWNARERTLIKKME